MARYESTWGGEYETEDEARESAARNFDEADFRDYFEEQVSYATLLEWAMRQNNFSEDFCDEICEAENEFFTDNYHEIKEE